MAKYKIGITEAGDAGLDFSWEERLNNVDGTVLVTKRISPEFIAAVMRHKDKVIVHATITGYGASKVEPHVPDFQRSLDMVENLVAMGFPQEKVVIRIDPIIPTDYGIIRAKYVFRAAIDRGFTRFRVSIIDMYPHVRQQFAEHGIPLPYGDNGFSPNAIQIKMVNDAIIQMKEYGKYILRTDIRIEACAEPGLTSAVQCGCISDYDLELLRLHPDNDPAGFQRKNCLCYAGKTELLTNKRQCPHGCLYCYWKN